MTSHEQSGNASKVNPPQSVESQPVPRAVPDLVIRPDTESSVSITPQTRPPRVLVVEDDALDRDAILRAFERVSTRVDVRSVQDGHSALEFLLRRGSYDGRWAGWHPDILLLDLGLPRVSGIDVLQAVRLDARLDDLICLVLTGSTERDTIRNLYRLGANGYLVKPDSREGFDALADKLQSFWFDSESLRLPR